MEFIQNPDQNAAWYLVLCDLVVKHSSSQSMLFFSEGPNLLTVGEKELTYVLIVRGWIVDKKIITWRMVFVVLSRVYMKQTYVWNLVWSCMEIWLHYSNQIVVS